MKREKFGACFEIIVDDKPRSMRDLKETAIEAGKYLKEKQPQSDVRVRDIRAVTVIDGGMIVELAAVAAKKLLKR
jgi:hypothetical protein